MNQTSHRNRIVRNVIYGFVTWLLPLFLGLVVTRVVVRALGSVDFGIYSLVLGFIAYSFNFNVGRAITKYLATYRASGDDEKIKEVVSAASAVALLVALTGAAAVILLSNWLTVNVFEIDPASRGVTVLALKISGVTIAAFMIGQIATAIFQGLHRFDVFSTLQIASSFALMCGNLVLAISGFGLISLLCWSLAVTALTSTVALMLAHRLLPEFGLSLDFGSKTLKLVNRYSRGVVGYQIAANAFFLFERGWITAKLGPESLTYYAIPMSLGIYFHG